MISRYDPREHVAKSCPQRMLVTEPSVSIFGEPLTTTQLAELAAEACQMCDENTKVLR